MKTGETYITVSSIHDMKTSVDNQEKDCTKFFIWFLFKQNYRDNPLGIHSLCMFVGVRVCVCALIFQFECVCVQVSARFNPSDIFYPACSLQKQEKGSANST